MAVIHGQDSAKNQVPLLLAADGSVILDSTTPLPTGTNTIGAVTSISADRIVSYSSTQVEHVLNLSAAAGQNFLTGATVPAGQIWRVQLITGVNQNTGMSRIYLGVNSAAGALYVLQHSPCVGTVYDIWTGEVDIPAGQSVFGQYIGCTLNDDIHLFYSAVVMHV